jgi:hypothetical protein
MTIQTELPLITTESEHPTITHELVDHQGNRDNVKFAIQEVELTDTDKIDIDKVIKREEISLNLNGIKYIFRGKDGIETTQNPASSITNSALNLDKFDKFLENKSKNAKLEHQLDSDNNHGIFIKNSQEAEIIVATPKTMLKSSKNITIKIIEDHKIDILHLRSRAPMISAYYAVKKTSAVLVSTIHGSYSLNFLGIKNSSIKKIYNSIMLRADKIIAVSN